MTKDSLVVKEVDSNKSIFDVKVYENGKFVSSTENCSDEIAWKLIREYVRKHQGLGVK